VDFLVGDEAFQQHSGGIVSLAPGVPISSGGVPIDHLGILAHERHLEAALVDPAGRTVPIASLAALVYLKLKSPRRRDDADVVELLKVNAPSPVRRYLEVHAPALLEKFDALAIEAQE
jgi:hypothetical protein